MPTSLMVGEFRSKALLTLLVEDETFASAFRCGNDRLWFLKQLYLWRELEVVRQNIIPTDLSYRTI